MTKAYFNSPNSRVTIHGTACGFASKARTAGQRRVLISRRAIDEGLDDLSRMPFRAEAKFNDVWIVVDLDDPDFEEALIRYIRAMLGKRYKRIRESRLTRHC